MAARARTCHAVPWANALRFHVSHSPSGTWFHVVMLRVYAKWFISFSRIYFFLQQHLSSRRTIKWRIIQLTQFDALDFALIHASCIYLSVCVHEWIDVIVYVSEMHKFDCKRDDLWNAIYERDLTYVH